MATITASPDHMQASVAGQDNKSLSKLLDMAGEIRNLIYESYFPALASAKAPLVRAHEYRPSTGLCAVDKGAWAGCTWTVDIDHFFPARVQGAENELAGAMYPADVVQHLTDADAAHIRTIEFSTSAFMLPEEEGASRLSKPFVFQVHRLSSNRLVMSTPIADEYWQRDVDVHTRITDMLQVMHTFFCLRHWHDKFRRGGRYVWTVSEIQTVLEVVQGIVSQCIGEAERDAGLGMGPSVMTWGEAWEELDERGVWDGRLPGGKKMRLSDMEAYVRGLGWELRDGEWVVQ